MADEKFYLERLQIQEDSDSEYNYEAIAIHEDVTVTEADEDLNTAMKTIQEARDDLQAAVKKESKIRACVTTRPEVVDDFVRNFLVKTAMYRTLDCFQTEWYEMMQRGCLNEEALNPVPDIYVKNDMLHDEIRKLKDDLQCYKDAALKTKEGYEKLRKERDYHRMHHKRVTQEKQRVIADLKRLKEHYASYEPSLHELKQKYEVAMKEKMLTKLERDRAVGQVKGLKSTLQSMESRTMKATTNAELPSSMSLLDPSGYLKSEIEVREVVKAAPLADDTAEPQKYANDSVFPPDDGINPQLGMAQGLSGHLTRPGGFHLTNNITAHTHAVSSLTLHPRKQILVSASDDCSWKMWAIPSGDLIMTGDGHADWVSSCEFHPFGTTLATTSGDTTVKIWDFTKAACVHTFREHTQAVWDCSWHSRGDFLATCSMDNTSKVWDINSLRCRTTLRGHAESVNCISFLPYTNTLITGSADKTVSLWDARAALCAQTFYGHLHSINDVTFNLRCDTVASCDSFGEVKIWDMRTVSLLTTVSCGPHPANKIVFDPAGTVLAIASNDSSIKMYELQGGQLSALIGHEDAVQCILFDRAGEFMVSGSSDTTVKIWS